MNLKLYYSNVLLNKLISITCSYWFCIFTQDSKIEREEMFLTTKCWPTDYGKDKTFNAFTGSCQRLNTDYLGEQIINTYVLALEIVTYCWDCKTQASATRTCLTKASDKYKHCSQHDRYEMKKG